MRRWAQGRWRWAALFALCVAIAGAESLRAGKDANWDLQNYHFYNAYAWLNGRMAQDVAPAMAQTYHNPLADLPFYAMVRSGFPPRAIQLLMALPAAIGAWLYLRVVATLFPPGMEDRRWYLGAALAIGFMGASARSVVASTMNEWQCIALVMAALALTLPSVDARPSVARLGLAGLFAGMAIGLKLTYAPYALALGLALMAFGPASERLRRGAVAGGFGVAGFLATYGFWAVTLQREFGNPFFPYLNGFFASPWWQPVSFHDVRYGVHGIWDAITYPFRFAFDGKIADDAKFRDPRVALLIVLAAACALRAAFRDAGAGLFSRMQWRYVALFAAIAYVAWLAAFGIYRYLIPVELLSGALITGCVMSLVASPVWRKRACAAVAVVVMAATLKQSWGRIPAGETYFDLEPPAMAAGALVVLEPQEPLAHVIPFFPGDARFVSPASNLLNPTQDNLLARRIVSLLEGHRGPLYSIDHAGSAAVDALLSHYRLRRNIAACRAFESPVGRGTLRLCPVTRDAQ